MNEMVERVARALYQLSPYEDAGEAIDGFQVTPGGPIGWADLVEFDDSAANHWREEARTAIAAMREPTEVMCAAGDIVANDMWGPDVVWRTMIDAALANGPMTEPSEPADSAVK